MTVRNGEIMESINWSEMSHARFLEELKAGLDERDERLQQMQELMGGAASVTAGEQPAKRAYTKRAEPKTRAEQLAESVSNYEVSQ